MQNEGMHTAHDLRGCAKTGYEGASALAGAVRGLPPQQQLLLCAAVASLGAGLAESCDSPVRLPQSPAAAKGTPSRPGTPARRLSNLGCATTPLSLHSKARCCHAQI
jgi:hypothetical protein